MKEQTDFKQIKCECCGSETLAEQRGDKLLITDRRHGKDHFVVISLLTIKPACDISKVN